MKKTFLFIICGIMALTLVTGCGNEKENNLKENNTIKDNTNNKINEDQEKYSVKEIDNGYEVVNSKNEVQFTTNEYQYLKVCTNNKTIRAVQGDYYIYLDLKGNRITDKNYWGMDTTLGGGTEFINGNVIVEDVESGKKGLLNENGKEVIECKYKYMNYDEDEKLYLVDSNTSPRDGSAYYINEKDEKVKDW